MKECGDAIFLMLDFDPGFFLQVTLAQRYFCSVCFLKTFLSLPPPGSGLNDGQWHAIRLVAKENFAMLTVDGEEASAVRSTSPLTITTGGTYHLGGKGHPNTIATDLTKTSRPSLRPAFIVIIITFPFRAHLGGKGGTRV